MHLRGIVVRRSRGDKWYFYLPEKIAYDIDTGDKVRYPIIHFEDAEKMQAFRNSIAEVGRAYITDNKFTSEITHERNKIVPKSPKTRDVRTRTVDKRARPSRFPPRRGPMQSY